MQALGVYDILCAYGKSYIQQVGRTIEIRLEEHERDIEYQRMKKSTIA